MSVAGSSPPPGGRAAGRFGLGPFGPPLTLVALMWITELVDVLLRGRLDDAGIAARQPDGVLGIIVAPFLHAGFGHLFANTLPLLVLGTLVAMHGRRAFWLVTALVVLIGGFGTWLIAPAGTVTIGASGIVFGYLGYLIVVGVVTRHWVDIALGVAVLLLYGTTLSGLLPWAVAAHISWQAHLCGAVGGAVTAWRWPPRRGQIATR